MASGLAHDIFRSLSAGLHFSRKNQPLVNSHKKHLKRPLPETFGESKNKDEQAGAIAGFRRRLKINVKGNAVPDPITCFKELESICKEKESVALHRVLVNIEASKYKEPTPVQMQTIPVLLGKRDAIVCAPTGSGKTAAFLIPLILKLSKFTGDSKSKILRAVVLAPTRELAAQILREIEKLSRGTGIKVALLRKALKESAKQSGNMVMISTPKRLLESIKARSIDTSKVSTVILDEVDKLFELGFLEQVDEVLDSMGKSSRAVQTSLYSATVPPQIEALAKSVLRDPISITIGVRNAAADTILQKLIFVGQEEGKLVAFQRIIQEGQLKPPALVFVQSKERAKELFHELVYDGFKVESMHSDRTQAKRDEIIKKFRIGEIWVLICTDLLARGVDFKAVNSVINYDLPASAVNYIHRVGRTGRAGRSGIAITFYTLADLEYMRPIANVMKLSGAELDEWILNLRKPDSRTKKMLHQRTTKRKSISTTVLHKKRMKREKEENKQS